MKKLFFIIIWLFSIIISIIWSYENPEKIENLKDKFKKNKSPIVQNIDSEKAPPTWREPDLDEQGLELNISTSNNFQKDLYPVQIITSQNDNIPKKSKN